jgi:hypothetical protein
MRSVMTKRRPLVSRVASRVLLAAACLGVGACLEGERPPIWSLYNEPTAQMPAVTGSTVETEQTVQQSTTVFGAPGTRITTYDGPIDPYHGGAIVRPLSGQPRYVDVDNGVRCDNQTRSCAHWSDRSRRFVNDDAATRRYYGLPAPQPVFRYEVK